MSKYISEFTSLNGVDYKVTITTEKGSSTTNFKLGGTPFVTQMDSDGKSIYSPIKTTGATISMLTDNLKFDIYTGKVQGTKVEVTSNNKIIYTGYVTPCAYSQGFDNELEEIQIECVDGIASLKDIVYTRTSNQINTFGNIIFNCLKKAKCYKTLYITDNVQLVSNGNISIIEKFRVSEQNFFDEKKDINQTDDDVAWSCYDVLYEICQYLGYTLFADGEDVYIIDYDAIKRGNNKYFKYSLTGTSLPIPTSVYISYSYHIKEGGYSSSGTSISLDDVYNKVSVKDDFYSFDSLFPDFGDISKEVNITTGSLTALNGINEDYYLHHDTFTDTDNNGNNENYQILISKSWKGRMWILIYKFYESPVLQFEKYNTSLKTNVSSSLTSGNFKQMLEYHGAYYARYFKREITSEKYNSWRANYNSNWNSLTQQQKKDAYIELLNNDPQKISLSPIITCVNLPSGHIGPAGYNSTGKYDRTDEEDCRKYPFIKLRGEQNSSIFGGEGSYVIITGTWRHHDESNTPFPLADGADNGELKREGDYKYSDEGFVWARFKWGDQYWNGEGWTSTDTDFKLRFWDPTLNSKNNFQNKKCYDSDYDFLETANAKFGCQEKGYYIPCPKQGNLQGTAEFVIYCNRDMWGDSRRSHWHDANRYSRYYSYVTFIKSLSIKAYISNGFLDDKENNSDTIYTNVIDNDSVKKMDDITFKICTFDNKKPTYSSVDYLDGNKSVYVTKTVNKALNSLETGSMSSFDNKTGLTQEEHLIFKLVSQYDEPKVIFECNLHNENHKLYGIYTDNTLSGKKFIPVEINTDYKMNRQTIKLTEKF